MKRIIDIPEYVIDDMKECGFIPEEDNEELCKAIDNGTPIPDNATACDIEQIRNEIEEASNRCNNAVAKGCYLFCLGVIDKYIYKSKEKKNIPICEKCKWAFKSCRNCSDNFNLFEPKGE